MRKALIVGIDHYDHIGALRGAVNDAYSVKSVLERNSDGTLNFAKPKLLAGTGPTSSASRTELRDSVEALFADDADIALFYFAGHGYIDDTGGFLCASDCQTGHDGLALHEVMTMANRSRAKNKVIILDSCHGGIAAANASATQMSEISDGVAILTASTADQYAMETGAGSGVFTSLLVDALSGAAANLVGDITPGSVYAHIDQSLGNCLADDVEAFAVGESPRVRGRQRVPRPLQNGSGWGFAQTYLLRVEDLCSSFGWFAPNPWRGRASQFGLAFGMLR